MVPVAGADGTDELNAQNAANSRRTHACVSALDERTVSFVVASAFLSLPTFGRQALSNLARVAAVLETHGMPVMHAVRERGLVQASTFKTQNPSNAM